MFFLLFIQMNTRKPLIKQSQFSTGFTFWVSNTYQVLYNFCGSYRVGGESCTQNYWSSMILTWQSHLIRERPHEANKVLCHQLSTLTLIISRYTIWDLEKLKGWHESRSKQKTFFFRATQKWTEWNWHFENLISTKTDISAEMNLTW